MDRRGILIAILLAFSAMAQASGPATFVCPAYLSGKPDAIVTAYGKILDFIGANAASLEELDHILTTLARKDSRFALESSDTAMVAVKEALQKLSKLPGAASIDERLAAEVEARKKSKESTQKKLDTQKKRVNQLHEAVAKLAYGFADSHRVKFSADGSLGAMLKIANGDLAFIREQGTTMGLNHIPHSWEDYGATRASDIFVSQSGNRFASSADNGVVVIWDGVTPIAVLPSPDKTKKRIVATDDVSFSKDGNTVFIASRVMPKNPSLSNARPSVLFGVFKLGGNGEWKQVGTWHDSKIKAGNHERFHVLGDTRAVYLNSFSTPVLVTVGPRSLKLTELNRDMNSVIVGSTLDANNGILLAYDSGAMDHIDLNLKNPVLNRTAMALGGHGYSLARFTADAKIVMFHHPMGNYVDLFEVATSKHLAHFQSEEFVFDRFALSTEKKLFASAMNGSKEANIWIWRIDQPEAPVAFVKTDGVAREIAFKNEGRTIVFVDDKGAKEIETEGMETW